MHNVTNSFTITIHRQWYIEVLNSKDCNTILLIRWSEVSGEASALHTGSLWLH